MAREQLDQSDNVSAHLPLVRTNVAHRKHFDVRKRHGTLSQVDEK
jgi:hypothetical protein